jgi:hypothetical protein
MIRLLPFFAAALLAAPAFAQVDCNAGMGPIDPAAESPLNAREFIRVIVANEHDLVKALGNHGYAVDIRIETLNGDKVDGEFHRLSVVDFDPSGARRETVKGETTNTLTRLKLQDKDIGQLGDPMSFALTSDSFADRDIVYSGRQALADRNLSVFDILPRSDNSTERAFAGRTWVRGRTSAIVKTCGRDAGYPIGNMRFEVVRAPIVADSYFPVLVRTDETTPVDGAPVHVRVTVKYTDYKARS